MGNTGLEGEQDQRKSRFGWGQGEDGELSCGHVGFEVLKDTRVEVRCSVLELSARSDWQEETENRGVLAHEVKPWGWMTRARKMFSVGREEKWGQKPGIPGH